MWKTIEDLLKPRTIFTGAFFFTFLYATAQGFIDPKYLVSIVTGLIGFWFGERAGKRQNGSR